MGEIGVQRKVFLYQLRLWEIKGIIKGYRKRVHDLWESTRFQTYAVLCAMGCKKIHRPQDLIEFPWEKERARADLPSADEIEELRREMDEINSQILKEEKEKQQTEV